METWERAELAEFAGTSKPDSRGFSPNEIVIRLFIDGDKWCALVGENPQSGTAGFGRTPTEAFDMLMAGLPEMDTLPDCHNSKNN